MKPEIKRIMHGLCAKAMASARRGGRFRKMVLAGLLGLWAGAVSAGILFDAERNAIRIVDYPPELPCTLRQLARADRAFGWGKVRYDSDTATCHIDGDLIIGANDGTETVLQVGTAEQPRETLIMRGNIFVHPHFVDGENQGLYWQAPRRMNALRLGLPGATNINAALRFACASNEHYTLYSGRLPWMRANQYGGGVYVYHGEITALDRAWPIGEAERGWLHMHGSVVLDGARIADVKGFLYGMSMGNPRLQDYLVRNTVFECVGVPVLNGTHRMVGCRFVNCGTVIQDYGSLKVELVDCVLSNNNRNWELIYSDDGLVLVDCEWDAPRTGDKFGTRVLKGKLMQPKLSVRRHVVVEVRDAGGQPVPGAKVSFRAEQDGCDIIQNRTFLTDARGCTPGRGAENAMLLTEYIDTARENSDQPARAAFTYAITVEYKDRQAVANGICPAENWKTFTVELFREP